MPEETNQQLQPEVQQQIPTAQAATPAQQTPLQQPVQPTGTSGMGVASLVLGILAILTSFLPIINNGSFILALLGLILGIVGVLATRKGKKGGKGIAIAGVVLNILSLIIVLATQSMYSAALDEVTEELENGSQPVATTPAATETEDSQSAATEDADEAAVDAEEATTEEAADQTEAVDVDYQNLPIGEAVEFEDGLNIVVNSVQTGLQNYDGSPVTGINVTYTNNGSSNASFNPFDWKALDTSGVLDSETFFTEGDNELSSGELTPGGTVTGNIYFDGDITNVYYYSNVLLQSNASAGWAL